MSDDLYLPSGWKLATVGEVLTDIQPGFASGQHNSEGSGLPHLRPMNVSTAGKIDRAIVKYVAPALADRPQRRLRRGDVLFNNTNSLELVGKTALFNDDDSPAFSNHMTRLRVRNDVIVPAYLARALHGAWRRGEFMQLANNHVSQASVGQNVLKALEILLPPLNEQERIAEQLDHIDDKKQNATEHLQAARRAIERFRQAVLAAACAGRLTEDWRTAHPELIPHAFPEPAGIFDRLVETPDSWTWAQLKNIADIKGGIQKGAAIKPNEQVREVPYLRVANVQRGWLDLSEIKTIPANEAKIAELTLEPGDILFNEGGDRDKLGRGWIWEGQISGCIHQNHVFRARLRAAGMQPKFYSWYGNTIGAAYFIDQGKQTVNLASLSMTKLKELPVPVPPVEEQAEIVRRVSAMLNLADSLLARINTASQQVERTSQAVLAKAFRGELTSVAQDGAGNEA